MDLSASKAGIFGSSVEQAGIAGLGEILAGARHWRVWHVLGSRELRQRYVRSRLGQFWLVLSTAIMIAAMTTVWSVLSSQPARELAPFIGIGLIIWGYFSQVLLDCTMVFISARQSLPQSADELLGLDLFRHLQEYHHPCA